MDAELGESLLPRPDGRTYVNPTPVTMAEGLPVVRDATLLSAATANRQRARLRMLPCQWDVMPSFRDIVLETTAGQAGDPVSDVHGDPSCGRQGPHRMTYKVFAFCNEVLRYGFPIHPYNIRLYQWALLFPIQGCETFAVDANNCGRLRRSWPKAVFLPRSLAQRLVVPFAQEDNIGDYLDRLMQSCDKQDREFEPGFRPWLPVLEDPFRAPNFTPAHRRGHDTSLLVGLGVVPAASGDGAVRGCPRRESKSTRHCTLCRSWGLV